MKPTLEEVKEHFKDAKVVKCCEYGSLFDITKNIKEGIHEWQSGPNYYYCIDLIQNNCFLWSEANGYAEIVEYKSTVSNSDVSYKETPERYKTNSIDVIDFCKLYELNFNLGSIVKYACRKKDQDIEDLKKIIDFAKREIKHLEKIEKQWEQIKTIQ